MSGRPLCSEIAFGHLFKLYFGVPAEGHSASPSKKSKKSYCSLERSILPAGIWWKLEERDFTLRQVKISAYDLIFNRSFFSLLIKSCVSTINSRLEMHCSPRKAHNSSPRSSDSGSLQCFGEPDSDSKVIRPTANGNTNKKQSQNGAQHPAR